MPIKNSASQLQTGRTTKISEKEVRNYPHLSLYLGTELELRRAAISLDSKIRADAVKASYGHLEGVLRMIGIPQLTRDDGKEEYFSDYCVRVAIELGTFVPNLRQAAWLRNNATHFPFRRPSIEEAGRACEAFFLAKWRLLSVLPADSPIIAAATDVQPTASDDVDVKATDSLKNPGATEPPATLGAKPILVVTPKTLGDSQTSDQKDTSRPAIAMTVAATAPNPWKQPIDQVRSVGQPVAQVPSTTATELGFDTTGSDRRHDALSTHSHRRSRSDSLLDDQLVRKGAAYLSLLDHWNRLGDGAHTISDIYAELRDPSIARRQVIAWLARHEMDPQSIMSTKPTTTIQSAKLQLLHDFGDIVPDVLQLSEARQEGNLRRLTEYSMTAGFWTFIVSILSTFVSAVLIIAPVTGKVEAFQALFVELMILGGVVSYAWKYTGTFGFVTGGLGRRLVLGALVVFSVVTAISVPATVLRLRARIQQSQANMETTKLPRSRSAQTRPPSTPPSPTLSPTPSPIVPREVPVRAQPARCGACP